MTGDEEKTRWIVKSVTLDASKYVKPVPTGLANLSEQQELLGDIMNIVHEGGYNIITEEEFEKIDALRNWIGTIEEQLPREGVVLLELRW